MAKHERFLSRYVNFRDLALDIHFEVVPSKYGDKLCGVMSFSATGNNGKRYSAKQTLDLHDALEQMMIQIQQPQGLIMPGPSNIIITDDKS